MTAPIMKFFEYAHLPEKLQTVSKPIGDLAKQMDEALPDGAEKSAGLRKLLEAKDCLVRAAIVVAALLFAVEITIPDAAADEYHDLGCYVGNMTRAEFYAAKDRQHEAFDAEVYRVEEAARIERNKLRWAALRPQEPCPFQVGERVIDGSYGDAVFIVQEVFYDGGGNWRLRSESSEHGVRDLFADQCEKDIRSPIRLTAGPLGIIGRRSSGSSSACANGQCNAAAAPVVQELQSAVGARPSLDAQRKRLTLAQRAVYNRLESNAALRDKFANEWNRRYAEKIDPNNLQQIIEIIVKYLPYVIEILMMFLKS